MPEYKDILLNEETNEVRIEGGDFVVGSCEGQNAKLILLSERGSYHYNPEVGVGIRRTINVKLTGGFVLSMRKEIISQFNADGSTVKDLLITPTQLQLTSERI